MEFQHVDPKSIQFVRKCSCGALTVTIDDNNYYMRPVTYKKIFMVDPRYRTRGTKTISCDHCVNHYGVDLCACGSGKKYDACDLGLKECGKPMQVIGEYTIVRASDAIGLRRR